MYKTNNYNCIYKTRKRKYNKFYYNIIYIIKENIKKIVVEKECPDTIKSAHT